MVTLTKGLEYPKIDEKFKIENITKEILQDKNIMNYGNLSEGESSDSCPSEDNLDPKIMEELMPIKFKKGKYNLDKKHSNHIPWRATLRSKLFFKRSFNSFNVLTSPTNNNSKDPNPSNTPSKSIPNSA